MAKKVKRKTTAKRKQTGQYWLTSDYIRDHDACAGYVEKFERAFGKGAPITLKNATKAARLGFPMTWLFDEAHNGYAASDHYEYTALPSARKKYTTVDAVAQGHAFMETLKAYPINDLLSRAEVKKRDAAIKKVKDLIEQYGFTANQLDLDPDGYYRY